MEVVKLLVVGVEVRLLLCKLTLCVLVEFVDEGVKSLVEVVLDVLLGRIDDCLGVLLPFAKQAVDGLLKRRCKCFERFAVLSSYNCLVRSLKEVLSVGQGGQRRASLLRRQAARRAV